MFCFANQGCESVKDVKINHWTWVGLALLLIPIAAGAQGTDEATLRAYVERQLVGTPGRVEVTVGELDSRRQLAPCGRAEPFVPPNARLWGRATLGVRCVEGAAWTVFVPLHVRIYGPVLVAARALPAGKVLDADDYRVAELELTREQPGMVASAEELRDRVTARPVAAGQPLRGDSFRVRPVLAPGDIVRVVHQGSGFTVSTEGKALGTATAGQVVRVQTESGRVVSGVASHGRIVEISLGP
jgi:flagellar basal body P-ring formation protein FlgA